MFFRCYKCARDTAGISTHVRDIWITTMWRSIRSERNDGYVMFSHPYYDEILVSATCNNLNVRSIFSILLLSKYIISKTVLDYLRVYFVCLITESF